MAGPNAHNPERRIQNALAKGIIVDPEYHFVLGILSWQISTKGYAEGSMYSGEWRKTVKLHHFIVGTPIDGLVIDHINRNKLDNRLVNLRVTNLYVNRQNSIHFEQAWNIHECRHGYFEVRFQREGRKFSLGTYKTEAEAIKVRDDYVRSENAASG